MIPVNIQLLPTFCLSLLLGLATQTAMGQATFNDEEEWAKRCLSDARIQEKLSKKRSDRGEYLVLDSRTLDRNLGLLQKTSVNLLLYVVEATNEDLEKVATLNSLTHLGLPVCRADDLRPLTKLKNLERLEIANPNVEQFREERLLSHWKSLRRLHLYNVEVEIERVLTMLSSVNLASSWEEKGLCEIHIHIRNWRPDGATDWSAVRDVWRCSAAGDRFVMAWSKEPASRFSMGSTQLVLFSHDAPGENPNTTLRRAVGTGFFNDGETTRLRLQSENEQELDLSPLKAFRVIDGLELAGKQGQNLKTKFAGFEALRHAKIRTVTLTYWTHWFPSYLDELKNYPHLECVVQELDDVGFDVLWQRRGSQKREE